METIHTHMNIIQQQLTHHTQHMKIFTHSPYANHTRKTITNTYTHIYETIHKHMKTIQTHTTHTPTYEHIQKPYDHHTHTYENHTNMTIIQKHMKQHKI